MRLPGPYVPLHVHYPRDGDIRRAGPDAELLFLRGLAYAKAHYTDGEIPDWDLETVAIGLGRVAARVAALVDQGLWQPVEGGWRIRGWRLWNETSEQTAAKRKRAAERQATKRERDRQATVTPLSRVSHT
jgi:hypothetical protein